ncbi:MAG: CoB--CoM heterodisulfide reductase iron-sulfur subunit A family protein [Promethearchaeota archaeon]
MEKKEKNKESIRVGVFVCHCGSNIAGVIDCAALADYAKTLPNVAHSEHNLYMCSENGLTNIKKAIEENNLNRIVVASCTPRTHEPLFRECISEAGLNPYLFNFVNIREQCSWVHMKYPIEALEKAKDLICMGVAKATKLEPLEMITVEINPSALVIGGGISGMSSAINLSRQGFKTYLVEKESKLGGRLNSLYKLFPHNTDASKLIKNLRNKVQSAQKLEVYKSATVKSIDGYVGNFEVEIEQYGDIIKLTVGAIIVAVGASEFKPINHFAYDGSKRISQYELESKLKFDEIHMNNIVMIQCVGARNDDRPYCSSVCCMTALKNGLIIKEKNPDANVTILFRDLYTPGSYEDYYKKARESGILFIKYHPEKLLSVEENQVKVFNEYIGEDIIIPYDLLVLSTPLVANDDNKDLAQMLKVPLESNNFFLEAHVKLRPNDFATDGIFISGSAKWPSDVSESITQGYAAAARASTIISKKEMKVMATIAEIDEDLCNGCGDCRDECVYNAILMVETELEFDTARDLLEPAIILTRNKSKVIPAVCKGCGVCAGVCPVGAITLKHFTDDQLSVMIESYLD